MPTYEYRCKACGDQLDVVQSFTDDALDTCPSCGGRLRKVFGTPGISFKGSGFYKTDSKASAASGSSSASGSSGSPGEAGSAGGDGSSSSSASESSSPSSSSGSSPESSSGAKAPTPA